MKKISKLVLIVFFSFFGSISQVFADFPEKEIKVIVNYGAGGGVDRTARSLQKFLPTEFGKTVVVENHKGAGGKIGLKKFLAEPRDGYTILTAFAPATTYVKFKDPSIFNTEDLDIINIQWIDPAIIIARKDTGWNVCRIECRPYQNLWRCLYARQRAVIFDSAGDSLQSKRV